MDLIKAIIENQTLSNTQKLELIQNINNKEIQKVNNQEPQPEYTKLQEGNCTYKLYPKGIRVLHSFDDQPATIDSDGTKVWYKDGKQHRTTKDQDNLTLPATIYPDGTKAWYKDGKYHRDDKDENNLTLPAYIKSNGYKSWWKDGKRHRDEKDETKIPLPAIIESNNSKEYYKEGKEYKLVWDLIIKSN